MRLSINQNGWKRYRKQEGFTLLECIIYLGCSLIIISLGFRLLLEVEVINSRAIKENINLNIIEEGYIFIDGIKEDADIKAVFQDNSVIYYSKENYMEVSRQLCIKDNNISRVAVNSNGSNTRKIIKKIENGRIVKKGKMIYLVFERNGDKFIKCLV